MKRYKCVIFDLDGTVLNTERMNMIPLQRLVKEELNIFIPYNDLLKYMAYPGIKTIEELGFKDIEKSYAKWVEYVNSFEEGATLYEGFNKLIPRLNELGIKCAIASSKMKKQYEIDFSPTGLEEYISCTVLAEDTERHKPYPDPLLKVCDALDLNGEECIYMGDTLSDYKATKAANMDFALAKWGSASIDGIQGDYLLDTPLDLLKYILI